MLVSVFPRKKKHVYALGLATLYLWFSWMSMSGKNEEHTHLLLLLLLVLVLPRYAVMHGALVGRLTGAAMDVGSD